MKKNKKRKNKNKKFYLAKRLPESIPLVLKKKMKLEKNTKKLLNINEKKQKKDKKKVP